MRRDELRASVLATLPGSEHANSRKIVKMSRALALYMYTDIFADAQLPGTLTRTGKNLRYAYFKAHSRTGVLA